MSKLFLNTRDELVSVDLDRIAFIKAEGNYSRFVYISGLQFLATLGIGKVEELLKIFYARKGKSPFVRMGRSYIINQGFLYSINIPSETLILSDWRKASFSLSIPKKLLRDYKELLKQQ